MASTWTFICDQYRNLPLLVTPSICSGATYIVTGSNTGLGYEAAKHLVACNSEKVIIAVRNVAAGEAAKAKIERATGKLGIAEVWALDLAEYGSVKAFAARARSELDRIDGVIENAGVARGTWVTAEGEEMTLKVNVLGTLLLGLLLLPKLSESAKKFKIRPHLSFVSSEVGFWDQARDEVQKVKDDVLGKMSQEAYFNNSRRYPMSKSVESQSVRELAKLVPVSKTGVVINYVNPGLCKTQLIRNANVVVRFLARVAQALIARTAEMGSRAILHAVVAGEESHGKYCSACDFRENEVPDWISNARGRELQQQIWSEVAERLELAEPGCVKKIL